MNRLPQQLRRLHRQHPVSRLIGHQHRSIRVRRNDRRRAALNQHRQLLFGFAPGVSLQLDFVELLPPLASSQIYTFPFPSAKPEDQHKDCRWTAMNFFRDVPDPRFVDSKVVMQTILTDYYPVHSEPRYGDLVAFDTDLVGPDGFLIDVSRTYLAGDGRPSSEQRELHAIAYEFLQAIVAQLRPGRSFAELGRQLGRLLPAQHQAQRYGMLAHGVGMQDEWPVVKYEDNYDGEVEVNMVLSAESYVGAVGGTQGVKLEEQLLVTESGCELLSVAPYDERLT